MTFANWIWAAPATRFCCAPWQARVTLDKRMLSAAVRRAMWRASAVSVFLCEGGWGTLRRFAQARRLIW